MPLINPGTANNQEVPQMSREKAAILPGRTLTLVVISWSISCVAVFGLGWYMGHKPGRPGSAPPAGKLVAEVIPCRKGETDVHVKSEKGKLLLTLTVLENPYRASGLTLCDGNEKVVLSTTQHANGATKEVFIMLGGLLKHRYGFYDNGDLEFVSKVVEASEGGSKVILQYYDHTGKPTRKRTLNVYHGS
jgi:hypothetical protein